MHYQLQISIYSIRDLHQLIQYNQRLNYLDKDLDCNNLYLNDYNPLLTLNKEPVYFPKHFQNFLLFHRTTLNSEYRKFDFHKLGLFGGKSCLNCKSMGA